MTLPPKRQRRLARIVEGLTVVTVLVAAAVLWCWYRNGGGFEAVYVAIGVVLAGLATTRRWLIQDDETITNRRLPHNDAFNNPRNRENLLNHVQIAWIDGFLNQSIHSEALKLAFSYRPDTVGQRPWQLLLRQSGQPDTPVPLERSLLDLFSATGRNLLILGEPGSGKTTTMLQLAESLIDAARKNPTEPIPIILNLSSWAREQKPLAEWLVEEMFVQYGAARELTSDGIDQNQFLYLLDGLDEVATEVRENCVRAINSFKEAHLTEMVVCGRITEYGALQTQLHLGAAVQIQPLNDAQINAYLNQDGLELKAVQATLAHDADLKELARTPLMLSLMTLAYRGLDREALRPLANKDARRRHLFENYVRQMFIRRPLPADNPYTHEQAVGWLAQLARGMTQHELSVFYIEQLQPTWLGENDRWRRIYQLIVGLAGGLIGGLVSGLGFGLIGRLIGELVKASSVGLISGLVGGLSTGLIVGFSIARRAGHKPIIPVEVLVWKMPSKQALWTTIKGGVIWGSIVGLLIGGLTQEWRAGLFLGLFGGLLSLLINFPQEFINSLEIVERQYPNEGIRSSAWNIPRIVVVYGIYYGLLFGLLGGLIGRFFGVMGFGLSVGGIIGLSGSLIDGLTKYGGQVVIQHYSLRCLLTWTEDFPYPFQDRHLISFLDDMHDRVLLRRVGGGWAFVHRSLLEYFADLVEEAPK